ncbi:MAG: hypothetical protein ACOC38_05715 [Promethearchaeia archaeon]
MLILIVISLTLASGTYMLVPDRFKETLHNGHDSTTSPRRETVLFPGRSSNWQLDIDLIMEEMPIDFVVSWFHLTWADYESDDEYKWGVLYEAFNVTEINETLDLNMSVYVGANILIRGVESGMYDMRGHIIATCDYYRPVIPIMVRDDLWLLAFVVTAVLVGDIISTYVSRRETGTS